MHVDIVISNSEINDQYVAKETPEAYGQWVQQWINTVVASGATPILEEPNPICEPGYDIPMTDQFVADLYAVAQANNGAVLPTYDAFKLYIRYGTSTGRLRLRPPERRGLPVQGGARISGPAAYREKVAREMA